MNDETITIHIIAKGLVQGVFFRKTVCSHAHKFGITGTVENLEDQSVEIYAQGSKFQLDEFLKVIRKEPGMGRVDQLIVDSLELNQTFSSFSVVR